MGAAIAGLAVGDAAIGVCLVAVSVGPIISIFLNGPKNKSTNSQKSKKIHLASGLHCVFFLQLENRV